MVSRDEVAHFIVESATKCVDPCGLLVMSLPSADSSKFSEDILKYCVRQASPRPAYVSLCILCA
jgi:hypothetical protein